MAVAQSQRKVIGNVIKSAKKRRKITKSTKRRRSIVGLGQAPYLVQTEGIAITGEDHGQPATRVKVSRVKTEKEERIAADDEDLAQEVDHQVRRSSSVHRVVVDLTTMVAQPCFRTIAIAVVEKRQKKAKINLNLVKAWDLIWHFMEIDSIQSRKWTNFEEKRSKMVAKKNFQKTKRRPD